ncbi:MAG: type II toxin-antitoxin system VapC family toxin [Deltaproteobacteria bacterium]|nr:type II toxin-antitoxin system VapC family toxin [Deltaproteobacteria bacterium]
MIYVDSNIPMYLVGADHPNKARVVERVPGLLHAREELVTSAEAFQEIIHRFRGLGDLEALVTAYQGLEALVVRTVEVNKEDTDRARDLVAQYRRLSSRDCLHVAVMMRIGCRQVWSFDRGFDGVADITRLT